MNQDFMAALVYAIVGIWMLLAYKSFLIPLILFAMTIIKLFWFIFGDQND